MGNFFSNYQPELHSCTPAGNPPPRTTHTVPDGLRLKSWRKELSCCGRDVEDRTETQRHLPKSCPLEPTKVSFLDLPGELRNNIYCRLFVREGYVRVTPRKPTKVLAVNLLRTCKQIHDEAAGIFYSANSFYCNVERTVHVLKEGPFPQLSEKEYFWSTTTSTPDCEKRAGGGIFPAPRYHFWLTRVIIDIEINVTRYPKFAGMTDEGEELDNRRAELHEDISALMCNEYSKMKALWEEKNHCWEGRMIGHATWRPASTGRRLFNFTLSFHEDEENELAAKGAFRQWQSPVRS